MELFGEFFGTMILIVCGCGVNAANSLNKTYVKNLGPSWVLTVFGWGFGVVFGVYTAAWFGAPGHLNPAVTVGAVFGGGFPLEQVLPYILAQTVGAMVGAAIVILHYYPHFKDTPPEEGNGVGIFGTGPAINNPSFNFISEFLATFIFIFALNTLGDFTVGLKPYIVGMLIVVIGISMGGTTGYAINPARDLGPRLTYQLLPVPHKTSANWSYAWIPILGPILGGIAANLLTFAFV